MLHFYGLLCNDQDNLFFIQRLFICFIDFIRFNSHSLSYTLSLSFAFILIFLLLPFHSHYTTLFSLTFVLNSSISLVSNVTRGGAMGAFAPPTPTQSLQSFNINMVFEPKLSNCTPKPSFWLRFSLRLNLFYSFSFFFISIFYFLSHFSFLTLFIILFNFHSFLSFIYFIAPFSLHYSFSFNLFFFLNITPIF